MKSFNNKTLQRTIVLSSKSLMQLGVGDQRGGLDQINQRGTDLVIHFGAEKQQFTKDEIKKIQKKNFFGNFLKKFFCVRNATIFSTE